MNWLNPKGRELVAAQLAWTRAGIARSSGRRGRATRVAGLALAATLGTLQPTAAGSPSGSDAAWGAGQYPAAAASCSCGSCGKKRKVSWARTLLDHVTAGTDRLIFGSSHLDYCDSAGDCDSACDAWEPMAPAQIPLSPVPYPTPRPPRFEPAPAPAHVGSPVHPVPTTRPTPAQTPTSHPMRGGMPGAAGDQLRDPFGDDPIYQGSTSPISRSAYYE